MQRFAGVDGPMKAEDVAFIRDLLPDARPSFELQHMLLGRLPLLDRFDGVGISMITLSVRLSLTQMRVVSSKMRNTASVFSEAHGGRSGRH